MHSRRAWTDHQGRGANRFHSAAKTRRRDLPGADMAEPGTGRSGRGRSTGAGDRGPDVARLFSSQSSIATVEMQITNPNFQRKISMQFWSVGESKILVRIRQPPEDTGTAILKVGEQRVDVFTEGEPHG